MDLAFLLKPVTWVASTLGGALLGAAAQRWSSRARPRVWLVDVRPSLSVNKRFVSDSTQVPVPHALRELVQKTFWTDAVAFREQSLSYPDLMEALKRNDGNMRMLLQAIARFKEALPRMEALLARARDLTSEEMDEFYDLWEQNDSFIYGCLGGNWARGILTLAQKTYSGEPHFFLREEAHEDWDLLSVLRRGGRFGTLLVPKAPRDVPFQREVATALAHFDAELLQRYLRTVKADIRDESVAAEITREIDKARVAVSRWAVTVAITNAGASPIAVLPFAELHVETAGLVADGNTIADATRIDLQLRDEDSEPVSIQVEGGDARLVTFASPYFIMDSPRREVLWAAYELGARECRTRLFVSGDRRLSRSELWTSPVTFAPSTGQTSTQPVRIPSLRALLGRSGSSNRRA